MSNFVGPVLPPHLRKNSGEEEEGLSGSEEDNHSKDEDTNYFDGPSLPPHLSIKGKDGSCKPADDVVQSSESTNEITDEADFYGPALPPGLRARLTPSTYQEDESEEDDDDVIGPVLPGQLSTTQKLLENRASLLKEQMHKSNKEDSSNVVKRESWMLELPPERAAEFGLGPRQFRKREREDGDRSVWTDTPQEKMKKETEKTLPRSNADELKLAKLKERDEAMEKLAKGHKSDKQKSLLEMHQDNLKKKKKSNEPAETTERRPFSREIDLEVNRFDEAQKKSIFKKAQLLNSRFSSGESKFL